MFYDVQIRPVDTSGAEARPQMRALPHDQLPLRTLRDSFSTWPPTFQPINAGQICVGRSLIFVCLRQSTRLLSIYAIWLRQTLATTAVILIRP
jgi:hypothetical protein